jgi:hypothetical protein
MSERKPFIPRDKPKSWVLLTLACLCGLGVGVMTFVASWLELPLLAGLMTFLFVCCSVPAAGSRVCRRDHRV